MSRSNYILFALLLSYSGAQAAASLFGPIEVEVIKWFGSMPIDATKTPVIFIKGSLPFAKKALKKAAENSDKALITGAGILAAGKSILEGRIAAEGIDQGVKVVAKVKEAVEAKIAERKKEEEPKKETIETVQVGL